MKIDNRRSTDTQKMEQFSILPAFLVYGVIILALVAVGFVLFWEL